MHLRLILPFGISFFTFETMSYTIDVYRRRDRRPPIATSTTSSSSASSPTSSPAPSSARGTCSRSSRKAPVFDAAEQSRGLWLIATGLVKKVVIGDGLSHALVNDVFTAPHKYSSVEVLVGVYGYAIALYSDFSGYTDIAIGSSLLFGYKLPENFNQPYTATNLQDFWHRWHMSLSSWLRDYLYIPLGGSKGSAWRTYVNLMLTMLIGGLWHGASWVFVIWGGLHGVVLAATRMWQRAFPPRNTASLPLRVFGRVIGTLLTFHFVCFAWISSAQACAKTPT